ncbi:MAG: efflux RND transporter permease subunit [Rhizobiales bacterium]|nr:efflux RND transporter permease subunit [Hyphomicrobiales bacterium]
MHWVTEPGTSHQEMNRITIRASKELRAIPGVRNFGAHIGQALLMDEVVGMHFGENWISVDPDVDYDETLHKIQSVVDGYPGLYRDVLTYLRERIKEVLTGSSESIVVRIYGPDLNVLEQQAQRIRNAAEGIEGLEGLHISQQKQIPQIIIKVDLDRAQKYGLKPGDIRRATSTLIAGQEVGDVYANGQTYDVQVWSIPTARASLTDIQTMLIDVPKGGVVQLNQIADVNIGPVPNVIKRELASRYINVQANIARGFDLVNVAEQVKDVIQQVDFPLEYRAELLGEYVELKNAQNRLFTVELIALIGIFFLLQAAFKSWKLASIVYLILPTALVGGVVAALISGGVLSLGSLVGFITVLGIAARNGILLISHYRHLQVKEKMPFNKTLILTGAKERLVPILMTTITTAIALLPLIIAGNISGHEVEFPMAIVILGGLITCTIVNLFVLPSLYLKFGDVLSDQKVGNLKGVMTA